MVSTPLLLANLKLLSVVNSDSQRTVTAALLHATHHLWVCVYPRVHTPTIWVLINCNILYHVSLLYCTMLVWIQFKTAKTCFLHLQVHRCAGGPCDLRQHPRLGEQAAATLPAPPRHHAGHRWGHQGVDQRVPAPVQTPSLELQHAGPRPHRVWTCPATE